MALTRSQRSEIVRLRVEEDLTTLTIAKQVRARLAPVCEVLKDYPRTFIRRPKFSETVPPVAKIHYLIPAPLAPRLQMPPPLPRPATPAVLRASRAAEEDAIAAFLAARGVTRGPTVFAAPTPQGEILGRAADEKLRDFQVVHETTVAEIVVYVNRASRARRAWYNGKNLRLDGEPCSRRDIVAEANRLRAAAGLMPYR